MEKRVYCMEHLHDNTENSKSSLTGQDMRGVNIYMCVCVCVYIYIYKTPYYTTFTILFGM